MTSDLIGVIAVLLAIGAHHMHDPMAMQGAIFFMLAAIFRKRTP